MQINQLGEVIIGESIRRITPSASLPFLLSTAFLRSPAGGPAESSLLPLALYNDASILLQTEHQGHLLPDLTGQANACLDELLSFLTSEVDFFRHVLPAVMMHELLHHLLLLARQSLEVALLVTAEVQTMTSAVLMTSNMKEMRSYKPKQ